LGKGLRYEITPFQGLKILWGLSPGRCPGLSQSAPLGRGGMGNHYAAFGAAIRVRTRQNGTGASTGPALATTRQDGGDAPTGSALAATRQGGEVRQWDRRWPQHGKTVGWPMGSVLAATRPKEIAQGNALGTKPPNQPSPERAKHKPIPHNTPTQTPPTPARPRAPQRGAR